MHYSLYVLATLLLPPSSHMLYPVRRDRLLALSVGQLVQARPIHCVDR